MNTEIDLRNNWEKSIDGELHSVRSIHDVLDKVLPQLKEAGEFPAQTLRRLLLEGRFSPSDLRSLRAIGKKGVRFLITQLGLAETDGQFKEKEV